MSAPRIRHIAICTKDPDGTAAFYEAAFGVKIVDSSDTEDYKVVFCTDGEITIALLDYKTDEAARRYHVEDGASWVGIQHFGFMVEDTDQALGYLKSMGVEPINKNTPNASRGSHFEAKIRDPNGIIIDVARTWPGQETAHAT